jgi:hypothetical protein
MTQANERSEVSFDAVTNIAQRRQDIPLFLAELPVRIESHRETARRSTAVPGKLIRSRFRADSRPSRLRREATRIFSAVKRANRQTICDGVGISKARHAADNVVESYHSLVSAAPTQTLRAYINMLLCMRGAINGLHD